MKKKSDQRHEGEHSLASNGDVKNVWISTSRLLSDHEGINLYFTTKKIFLFRALLPTHCRCRRVTVPADSPGRGISPSHSQKKNIDDPGGIRTRNPNKREAADLPLRPRGHRHGFYKNFTGCWKVLSPTRKERSYSDRRFWFSYILFTIIIGGTLVLFIYITRLASNEIFQPSNKIHREVSWTKDLPATLYSVQYQT